VAHTGLPAATKCWRPNADALIGIILLIGIVKKNGIMMIDFALEAERNHGKKTRGCNLRSLPASLPSDHDNHHGRTAGWLAARTGHRYRF
jgi:hypothetical protein